MHTVPYHWPRRQQHYCSLLVSCHFASMSCRSAHCDPHPPRSEVGIWTKSTVNCKTSFTVNSAIKKIIIRPTVHSHSGNIVIFRHNSWSLMGPDVPKLVEQWSIDQNVTAMSTELCSSHVKVSESKIANPILLLQAPHSATAPRWKMSKMLTTISLPYPINFDKLWKTYMGL